MIRSSSKISLARYERDSLDAQSHEKLLHIPNPKKSDVESKIYSHFIKTSWIVMTDETLQPKGISSYSVSSEAHFLLNLTVRVRIPKIRSVAQGIKVSLTPDFMHHFVKNITFEAPPIKQTFDSVWFNIYRQYFLNKEASKKKQYDESIGNIETLVLPQKELESKELRLYVPLWFSDLPKAFPLVCCGEKTRSNIRVTIEYEEDITKLIRVYEQISGGYKVRAYSNSDSKIITIGEISKPEIHAHYALCTESEAKWIKKEKIQIRIPDIISINPSTEIIPSTSLIVNTFPDEQITGLYWVFENMRATKTNDKSNYTTNNIDYLSGSDPLKHVSLIYDTMAKYDKATPSVLRDMEYWFSKTIPERHGYYSISLSDNGLDSRLNEMKVESAFNLRSLRTQIIFNIEEPGAEKTKESRYKLKLRLLNQKCYTISNGQIKEGIE
uniref:Major capsid protein n=1 Tax=Pithovirus LCDPAC01 TaxID=2506600 RepID=A0A481YN91_9VIRU|nr:MAG: major capsid protein [Pithovirus LCDPAC01]